ncbi:MAG: recombinase family protein [Deltaproteobacteria bacterium]|nr:recombinase family protein [Deltaproteobacteria bacterium]
MSVTEHDVQPEHVNELRGILALASAAQQNRAAVELALQMRAAVYARRSTEEQQGASLDVQLEEARRYIAGKGWTLDEQLIFVEDGVSRAEFQKRPALIKMITAAEARRFDALVVRDESRLGGDTARTTIIMSDLIDCGVRLFHYSTDEEIVIENAVDRFIVTARNFAAEVEREKIASRTREHHKSKARRGLNTGGKLYGYDNHEVKQGERRTHVEYVLNENEAAVVRELFERFAAGEGYRPIARSLNDRRIPSPRAGGRGTGSWAPSVIRAMLANEMYRGVRIWGRFEKGYRKGTKVRLRRPDSEWVRVEKPELRIVSDELWDAVVRRRQAARRLYGRGGPSNGKTPRMLSGLAKCGLCGGPMHVEKARFGKGSVRVYYCAWHRTRGSSVCANSVRRPEAELNDAVVQWIKKSVLSEELIVATLDEVRRRLRSKQVQVGSEQKRLREDAAQLRIEIDRLTTALAATDAKPASVIRAIAERESRLAEVEATLAAAEATPQIVELELRRLEREARARLEDLRGLLERNPVEGRKVLEALLVEPLTFTPTGQNQARRYEIRGRFVTGAVCGGVSVPTGI